MTKKKYCFSQDAVYGPNQGRNRNFPCRVPHCSYSGERDVAKLDSDRIIFSDAIALTTPALPYVERIRDLWPATGTCPDARPGYTKGRTTKIAY